MHILCCFKTFAFYPIDAPGHEQLGANVIASDVSLLSVDDLADHVVEVLGFFGCGMCGGRVCCDNASCASHDEEFGEVGSAYIYTEEFEEKCGTNLS
ncbi:hypothetical protein V6N11_068163 [Hibiscus sabdariffa]|uniref:Uncharacterized protein n=1 Tax=Hibiscus sabdariffa TaxID=183260 RepID=A0ABR2STN0_9ROSI